VREKKQAKSTVKISEVSRFIVSIDAHPVKMNLSRKLPRLASDLLKRLKQPKSTQRKLKTEEIEDPTIDSARSEEITVHQTFIPDYCKVIHQGTKQFWRFQCNLDITVINHEGLDCLEIATFNARTNVEAPRLYVDSKLLTAKIDSKAVSTNAEGMKGAHVKLGKSYSWSRLLSSSHQDSMIQYLMNRLAMLSPSLSSESDPNEFRITLNQAYNDTIDPNTGKLDILLAEKPKTLIPFPISWKRLVPLETIQKNLQELREQTTGQVLDDYEKIEKFVSEASNQACEGGTPGIQAMNKRSSFLALFPPRTNSIAKLSPVASTTTAPPSVTSLSSVVTLSTIKKRLVGGKKEKKSVRIMVPSEEGNDEEERTITARTLNSPTLKTLMKSPIVKSSLKLPIESVSPSSNDSPVNHNSEPVAMRRSLEPIPIEVKKKTVAFNKSPEEEEEENDSPASPSSCSPFFSRSPTLRDLNSNLFFPVAEAMLFPENKKEDSPKKIEKLVPLHRAPFESAHSFYENLADEWEEEEEENDGEEEEGTSDESGEQQCPGITPRKRRIFTDPSALYSLGSLDCIKREYNQAKPEQQHQQHTVELQIEVEEDEDTITLRSSSSQSSCTDLVSKSKSTTTNKKFKKMNSKKKVIVASSIPLNRSKSSLRGIPPLPRQVTSAQLTKTASIQE
jgi:hypothetical protein